MIKLRALLRLGLLFSCCVLSLNSQSSVAEPPSPSVSESDLKAAYLIHLSEFTTWPDEKMQQDHFSICIATGSSLSTPLEEIRERPVKDKPLNIIYDVPLDKLNSCHVLYVEHDSNGKIFQQIKLKNNAILTVSSDANFAKDGGVIQYYPDDGRIKMLVNLKVMNQEKLLISSKLLRLMNSDF
jgi:hypothetical protein